MTQIATVERIIDADHAEISVPRKSACGHDCEECAGCGVTGAAVLALVYLTPVLLFLAGYFITMAVTSSAAIQYLAAGTGFAAGILLAVLYDRRLRQRGGLSFQIVRLF